VTVIVHNTDGIHPWKARKEHESWWDIATVQSVGAAIENMLLAATELGLGSLWIADVWEAYPELNAWLETDHQLVSAVSFGYADVSPQVPPRKMYRRKSPHAKQWMRLFAGLTDQCMRSIHRFVK